MSETDREWIMAATMEQLLLRWRMAPIGDGWFADEERGKLHAERMDELRRQNPAEWTAASKRVGWG